MEQTDFDRRIVSMKDRAQRLARTMLGCAAEADDAVQDVMEHLWLLRARFRAGDNVEAMVFRAVRNKCIDKLRSRKKFVAPVDESPHDISHQIEVCDMRAVALGIIARLPHKQQLVIRLRDVEEMEFDEIALATGLSEAVARVTLSRARKAVKEKLIKMMNHGL